MVWNELNINVEFYSLSKNGFYFGIVCCILRKIYMSFVEACSLKIEMPKNVWPLADDLLLKISTLQDEYIRCIIP